MMQRWRIANDSETVLYGLDFQSSVLIFNDAYQRSASVVHHFDVHIIAGLRIFSWENDDLVLGIPSAMVLFATRRNSFYKNLKSHTDALRIILKCMLHLQIDNLL